MRGVDDMAERHGAVLSDLAELGLEFARDLKAKVKLVATVQDAERLALAFHRISRSVRLTLALESKLARERLDLIKAERGRFHIDASERKDQVRAVLTREIWAEREGEAAELLVRHMDECLEEDALFEAFLTGPVETAIARIREDLGLAANDAGIAPKSPSGAGPPPPDPSPLAGEGGLRMQVG